LKDLCSFLYSLLVNISSTSSLFTVIPVVVPIATAFATVRIRVTLSPQAKIPLIVVLWEVSIFIYPSSVSSQPNCFGI